MVFIKIIFAGSYLNKYRENKPFFTELVIIMTLFINDSKGWVIINVIFGRFRLFAYTFVRYFCQLATVGYFVWLREDGPE